ncbi:UPF0103-domain-containing protein [Jaminaea rosea]|uniref:UPF0103-domain-containing protein n=1 Tax=Jaminaea rosea TaxID=1569628 RepID=A0A316USP8_9BASI|nr:UPF0103-domain-containing protein [Jaminaea rosea]PWN28302.1 UPF0103-domain-containing protein [Jaminaea rosea]
MVIRRATHAGSWYTSDPVQLNEDLTRWLAAVDGSQFPPSAHVADEGEVKPDPVQLPVKDARALIGPHAGYSYSGPPAAYAYRAIPSNNPNIKRIFMLGPSHHFYLDGCALSRCEEYETPIGNLPVDTEVTQELYETGEFEWMSRRVDEDEHSMEMHAPYVRKVFESRNDITIVPILVGAISATKEDHFGRLLAPYLADASNFFVVSSDFCHWGSRFSYTFYRPSPGGSPLKLGSGTRPDEAMPIHRSIRQLDDEGMQAIAVSPASKKTAKEAQAAFTSYLRATKNTICGRHPIAVLLGALACLEEQGKVGEGGKEGLEVRFTRYEQSSPCQTARDSSVSYASAFVRF